MGQKETKHWTNCMSFTDELAFFFVFFFTFSCLTGLFSLTPTAGNLNGSNLSRKKRKDLVGVELQTTDPKAQRLDRPFNQL